MPKADLYSITVKSQESRQASTAAVPQEAEARYVKIVVFDEQNRVLAIKNKSRFILPGGRVEWDDEDAEAAARREVFEAANIALGIAMPVTVIKTKNHQHQTAQTIVFVARLLGEASTAANGNRFMDKETFFKTSCGQADLVRSLVEAAHRVLVSEEIKGEHEEAARTGREKYNYLAMI